MSVHDLRLRQLNLEFDMKAARRRLDACVPSSPAWDAAMGMVEDLERQLWMVERMRGCPTTAPAAADGRAQESSRAAGMVFAAAR